MDRIYLIGRDAVPERICVRAGESLSLAFVALPGVSGGMDLEVSLDGEGASLQMCGVYVCRGEDRVTMKVDVRHNVPGCSSDQIFRGVLDGNARASFDGLVYVAAGADRTTAHQENHSILLSAGARAESRPQLEIYADDVECSHGSTSGFLSEDELFYMRSRGISEAEARKLQILSFLSPVLRNLPADLAIKIEEAV